MADQQIINGSICCMICASLCQRVGAGIAVTAVINLPASGGRREFVYDCGVIGMCPPCTRATPLTGVGSLLVGGWGSGALHHKNCSVEVKIMQYPCDLAPLPARHRIPVGG